MRVRYEFLHLRDCDAGEQTPDRLEKTRREEISYRRAPGACQTPALRKDQEGGTESGEP